MQLDSVTHRLGPDEGPEVTCDLLVVGSGAGGLSAAVTAARLGLSVIVAEKEAQVGGTSAWSGGWMWIPRNPLAQAADIVEPAEAPANYLRHELGDGFDEALVTRFLAQGPKMVAFFTRETAVQFVPGNAIPDFHGRSPGAATGGRSVCAAPFDGRLLGPALALLKPPLDLVSPFGMGIASGPDLRHFLSATRSFASFRHVARRLARHALDTALHGRGQHLVNGNALVARLMRSALDNGVRILVSTPVVRLVAQESGVQGAVVKDAGREVRIVARRGVVLAAGGFPHDQERIARLFAHAPTGREHWSAAPRTNTGDGLRLGEAAGGVVRRDLAHAAAWAPVSIVPGTGGRPPGHYPHLLERAKPGAIMVLRSGRRFCNEADSYHDVMSALFASTPPGQQPEAWIVCDHAFLGRYGLGRVRPRPFPIRPWLRNGYLQSGSTPAALAVACGIDSEGLAETIEHYNSHALHGEDPAFDRGGTPYNRVQGDAQNGPNPCVAPIAAAPLYAVRVVPGSLGTFAGLRTDADARVLDAEGRPVAGLYAVGNDMASVMAGRYPSGGITLGPAMTFGYVAAHHAAHVPLDNNHS